MNAADPWTILGLPAGSPISDARAARKLLARQLHPDLFGDDPPQTRARRLAHMMAVNRALADIEAQGQDLEKPPCGAAGPADGDNFSVPWLPAEAFEALFLVSYGLGDIVSTDEPYRLELYLTEPAPCFCQLTLMPEAGGSMVMVDVDPPGDGADAPAPSAVRDVLVAELDRLVPG